MSDSTPLPARFLSFGSTEARHDDVGGKAYNLIRLSQKDFQVPPGFIITTEDYSYFVHDNGIDRLIQSKLNRLQDFQPSALDDLANELHASFLQGELSKSFTSELQQAYDWLAAESLAVRSSATAEDLPQASFAGQQATYLNVRGFESLLEAVLKCWASLWTARAISYRHQNNIDQVSLALAIVVQQMIPSQASGVMFTADPVTGLRSRIHIDAAHGLGEAIVSGEVEPDHFVVDKTNGQLVESSIGSKSMQTLYADAGGVKKVANPSASEPAIAEETIMHLAELGAEIEQLFETPQDIEWAYVPLQTDLADEGKSSDQGQIYILQSRPITSLFPLPEDVPPVPPHLFLFFGTVQGLVDPMTPIGQDAIRLLFAGGASLFGIQVDHQSQGVVKSAGERLWVDFTSVLHHPIGAKLMPRFIGAIEPGSQANLHQLITDESVQAGSGKLRVKTLWRVARFASSFLWRGLNVWLQPEGKAKAVHDNYQAKIRQIEEKNPDPMSEGGQLKAAFDSMRQLRQASIYAVPEIGSPTLAGLLPLFLLTRLSKKLTGSHDTALEITRGLPHNVTTEMDLALWRTSRTLNSVKEVKELFGAKSSDEISDLFLEGKLPTKAQNAITNFLDQYGMRGLAEIDLGRARWSEQPAPVVQTLQSYLQMKAGAQAPQAVFEGGKQSAQQAIERLEGAVRQSLFGPVKAAYVRALARRVRALAGLRESPKFYIVQLMWVIRQRLLTAGEALATQGVLARVDDIFFLTLDDLAAMIQGERQGWQTLIEARRASYQRELRRRQVPRLLLSDGRSFYGGVTTADDQAEALEGSPVSPGVAEGRVRIVTDPHKADLVPGEIMVCRGTDPSWTPLFLAASGLVMELGGMMTHGAIVAREYGIPAVVGVDSATQRLKSGDRVRIDGSQGTIKIIKET